MPGVPSSSTFGAAGLGIGAPSDVSSFPIASIGSRSPRSLAVVQPFVSTSTAFSFCPVLDEALAEVLEDAREAGAEFEGPLEGLDGLGELAVVHERLAEAEVGEVVVRVALDHVAVVGRSARRGRRWSWMSSR